MAAQPGEYARQVVFSEFDGGEVVLAAGQQIAALGGLGVGQQLAQAKAVIAGDVPGLGLLQRFIGAPEGSLADAHDSRSRQRRKTNRQAAVAAGTFQPGIEMTQHRQPLSLTRLQDALKRVRPTPRNS